MRADMHKVFSSSRHRRGRLWSKVKQKGSARARPDIFDEDQPHTERIRNRKGHSRRQKYDVLRRYIRSQVGRPWSEVYSEICEQLDTRNELQRDVRDWLKGYVEESVVLINGVPHESRGEYRVYDVWVHPDTGILMKPPAQQPYVLTAEQLAWRERAERERRPRYKIDATHRLVWLEGYEVPGRWYVVTLKPLPETLPEEYTDWPHDVVRDWCSSDYQWFRRHQFNEWGDYVYAAEKRPATNKLVRRFTKPQANDDSDDHVVMRSPER